MGEAILLPSRQDDAERARREHGVTRRGKGNHVWLITAGGARMVAAWPAGVRGIVSPVVYFSSCGVVLAVPSAGGLATRHHTGKTAAWRHGVGLGAIRRRLRCRRGVRRRVRPNLCKCVPFSFRHRPAVTYPADFFALLNPVAVLCGRSSRSRVSDRARLRLRKIKATTASPSATSLAAAIAIALCVGLFLIACRAALHVLISCYQVITGPRRSNGRRPIRL